MRTEKHIIKNRYSTHGIHRNIPVYEMNTVHCSASPMEGYKGTEVTLIDNAAWNEKFSAWALTGATATSNNIVLNNDVTAQGIYETAKNITYGARTSGNKVSGFIGDQVTITGTPAWNEKTSSYSITGATLTGNKFNLTGSNVTAKANFETAKNIQTNGCTVTPTSGFIGTVVTAVPNPAWNEKLSSYKTTGATHTGNNFTITGNSVVISAGFETAKNVTLQTDGGGTINSTKMSGFIGDQATLSNTPDATHVFSGYTITGANLTGNKFNFTGSNVTAKAWFKYFNTPLYTAAEITEGVSPNIYLSGKTDFVVVKFDELMLTDYYPYNPPALTAFRISAMNTIMSFNVQPTMEGCDWPGTGVYPDIGKYHKFPGGVTEAFSHCDNYRNHVVTAVTSGRASTLEYVPNETITVKFIVNLNRLTQQNNIWYAIPNMSAFIPNYTTLPIATYSLGSCQLHSPSMKYFKRVRIDGASASYNNRFNMLNYSVSTADTLEHALAI